MTSYSGDPSLSADLKERIQKTFAQSLDLASAGSREEARLGCDFILRMDPKFSLAQALIERLESEGAVEVTDLREGRIEAPAPPREGFELDDASEISDFDELEFEVPAATVATPIEPQPATAVAQPMADSGLAAAMEELVGQRDSRRVIELAEKHKEEVAASPRLRKLVETAYSLLESEPYVRDFLDKARLAIQEGNAADAHQLIEKARSLDPEHPGIAQIEQAQGFYDDPARRMGARREGVEIESEPTMPSGVASGANETLFEPSSMVPPMPPTEPSPPQPAAPPAEGGGGASGDSRIQELLDQGQTAYDNDDYQSAIDAWSRIFLIDIDHEEAARRIEEARGRKAENERRVEEVYQEALTAFDSGDRERAKTLFQQVLELAPNHLASREYLGQLERVEAPAAAAPPPPPAGPAESADPPAPSRSIDDILNQDLPDLSLEEEIFEPPTAAAQAPAAGPAPRPSSPRPRVTKSGRSISTFLYIGGAVLVLVAALGYLAWDQREKWFPNSTTDAEEAAAAEPSAVERAQALYDSGKKRAAARLLEMLPEDDPDSLEAQELLASWEAGPEGDEEAPEQVEEGEEGISLTRLVRYQELLDRARQAFLDREYLLAERYFSRAALIRELPPEDARSFQLAQQQLEPLSQQIELFEDDDWQYLLPTLWSMLESEPDNRDVIRLIVDSYYNLGVRDLQRGKADLASQKFREAQRLRPEDAEVQRHLAFSETYTQRPKDLLYRIYIKYLPFR